MMKKIKSLLTVVMVIAIGLMAFVTKSYAATDATSNYDAQRAKEYFASKMAFSTGPVEVSKMLKSGNNSIQIVDVRYAKDFAAGHVPGAISLPPEAWDNAKDKLSKDKTVVLYCYSEVCHLAAEAASKLAAEGYHVMEMDGGYKAWIDNKLQIERS